MIFGKKAFVTHAASVRSSKAHPADKHTKTYSELLLEPFINSQPSPPTELFEAPP